ncbi:MAG: SMP-30/gluconolactonase/LRE family protein [Halieaceae bacterium]|nr:SMP-30/gluconolactonase/LRE family protein [Halieaceae bacterium]
MTENSDENLEVELKIHEVLREDTLHFLECPRFDDSGSLFFGDVMANGFYRFSYSSGLESLDPSSRSVGGSVVHADGGMIYSGREGLKHYHPVTGQIQVLSLEIDGEPLVSINDIEADHHGNLYGGTLDFAALERGEKPGFGFLFRIDVEGNAIRIRDVGISNGIAFASDGGSMYFSESGEGVFRYAINNEGNLVDRNLVIDIGDSDGVVLDESETIWVARYMGSTVERYSKNGELISVLETPFENVASLVFGGDDNRELFIVGGAIEASGSGGIVKVNCEVAGLKSHKARIPI